MAAGKRNSTEVTIAYDDGPGGTARTLTGVTLEMGGLKIVQGSQEGTAYGDTLKKVFPTGVGEIVQATIRGFMSTAANSTHAVFKTPDTDPNGDTRTLTVGLGDSVEWETEGFLVSYEVITKPNALTEFVAVIQQNSGGWQ
jgi:hypothetical protein